MLVELGGRLSTAVCAEPAIRSLKSKLSGECEVCVVGAGAELYLEHPCVTAVAENNEVIDATVFSHHFRIPDKSAREKAELHLVDWCATWLGVQLENRNPRLVIQGQDYVRYIQMGLSKLKHPRVVIAPETEGVACFDAAAWSRLVHILRDTARACVIQVGTGEGIDGVDARFEPKDNWREDAILLSGCEIAVTENNGWAHLAAALELPRVVFCGNENPNCFMHPGAGLAVAVDANADPEAILSRVIDAIMDLAGNAEHE